MELNSLISTESASLYAKAKSRKDGLPPRISRHIISVVFVMLCALIWWASITEIREISRSSGEIAPTGALVNVQHTQGGVISDVYKRSGDTVEKGEPIASLSPERLQNQISQLKIRTAKLRADVRRYQNFLTEIPTDISLPSGPGQQIEMVELAAAQQATFMARRTAQAKRIRQFANAVRLAKTIRDNMDSRLKLAMDRETAYRTLTQKGVVSKRELGERTQETHEARSALLSAEASLQKEKAQYQDAESAYEELLLDTRENNLEALTEASAELAQAEQQLADGLVQLEELTLRAPISGVIQRINGGGTGEVLRPGDSLAAILPTGLELIADVELPPKDVGHVSVGDPVVIKVTTFDQKRFGTLNGIVQSVSPTTEINAREHPFFRVRIELNDSQIGQGTNARPLRAGMEVNAEILTSSRTIAEYLLKPINRTLSNALGER